MSGKEDSRICTEDICVFVKEEINYIVTEVLEAERKEAYNTFYINLLNSTGDGQEPGEKLGEGEIRFSIAELCKLAKTDGKNVHLWESGYTPEIAKMYNILTSSLAVLCNSLDDRCNFEEMKALQLEILERTNKIVIKNLSYDEINSAFDKVSVSKKTMNEDIIDNNKEEKELSFFKDLAILFNATSEFFNNNNDISKNSILLINKMIKIIKSIDVGTAFSGAFECYNRFLISAIGNKLTTIFNSVLLAGLTALAAGSTGYAVLVDTLNEQNLLQLAATLYYYSQFIHPTLNSLFQFKELGDSIKIHLMTKIPNFAKEKIDVAADTIRYYINKLAKQTENMTLEHTEKVVKDITNITKIIEKAIPKDEINAGDVIIVENDENEEVVILNPELIMNAKDRHLLESYLNENAEREEEAGLKKGGPVKGGKKHKKSNKKRHQKTHKKQLKPKTKSHKMKNKPKAKSHKKK